MMMKRLLLCSFIGLLFSCQEEVDLKHKTIALNAFDQIELNDGAELYIIEDSSYSAEIVADEAIIENIEFSIDNNILRISNSRKVKWRSPKKNKVKIYISALPLKRIDAEEGSNIQTISPITSEEFGLVLRGKSSQADLELNAQTFFYWNNFPNGGKLTLSGEVNELKLWNFALMSIDAKNLIANYAIVENNSKGNCQVTVLNRLEYSIRGEGNIILYGDPTYLLEGELSSSGRLIKQ